ncbi:unnamed protein product [Arabidopsis halleri]
MSIDQVFRRFWSELKIPDDTTLCRRSETPISSTSHVSSKPGYHWPRVSCAVYNKFSFDLGFFCWAFVLI